MSHHDEAERCAICGVWHYDGDGHSCASIFTDTRDGRLAEALAHIEAQGKEIATLQERCARNKEDIEHLISIKSRWNRLKVWRIGELLDEMELRERAEAAEAALAAQTAKVKFGAECLGEALTCRHVLVEEMATCKSAACIAVLQALGPPPAEGQ